MIIGNGMIADIFKKYAQCTDVVIFASGVSNSNEIYDTQFDRERELLFSTMEENKDSIFVYFSSCSLEDFQLKNNPYHAHKRDMERIVQRHANKYLIFRVPNLIGMQGNNNNLVNFLLRKIKAGDSFLVWEGATRNIVDIEDMRDIVIDIIDCRRDFKNSIVNIAYDKNLKIIDIVKSIEAFLGKKALYELENKGVDIKIDNSDVQAIMKKLFIKQPTLMELLFKYKTR